MPILESPELTIDYRDSGSGPPVLLVHSSVSGSRQWDRLAGELEPRFRVIAPNLFGYGKTTPWRDDHTQTFTDQANLVLRIAEQCSGPIRLAGHSFGGSVALKAATMLGDRVSHLFLFEPNPFGLLAKNGQTEAYAEAMELRAFIKTHGAAGDWAAVAERFVEYWAGDGAWALTPQHRREAYMTLLRPNFFEWDCFEHDDLSLETIARISAKTLVVTSTSARRPIREIAQLIEDRCPTWSFATVTEGGHMAPITQPHLVNPLLTAHMLEEGAIA